MALDGTLLARARARLRTIKTENENETSRRRAAVYARLPEVAQIDAAMRRMMSGVVSLALRRGLDPAAEVEKIADENLRLQERRRSILVGAGYSADYLDEIRSCPRCSDTGFVNGKICSCLKALYDEEQAKELSSLMRLGSESFDSFDLNKYDNDTYYPAVKGTARGWMTKCLARFHHYAAAFGEKSPSLLFTGGTGLGKTFSSACIARETAKQGFSVVYETALGVLEPFEAIKFGRAEPDSEAYTQRGRILGCDLLILDDLGTEMQTAFSDSVLYTIVNTRLISGKKTIISTNLDKDAITARYGAQLSSRLLGEYAVVPFVGRDIRFERKEPDGARGTRQTGSGAEGR